MPSSADSPSHQQMPDSCFYGLLFRVGGARLKCRQTTRQAIQVDQCSGQVAVKRPFRSLTVPRRVCLHRNEMATTRQSDMMSVGAFAIYHSREADPDGASIPNVRSSSGDSDSFRMHSRGLRVRHPPSRRRWSGYVSLFQPAYVPSLIWCL